MNGTVLVFQEDSEVKKRICDFLCENGYKAQGVTTAADMKKMSDKMLPDVIIADVSGIEAVSSVGIPYIIVSSLTSESVKVKALDGGAQDYIVRPFMKQEFLARLRAVLRRNGAAERFTAPGLEIDFSKHSIKRDGTEIRLTPVEYKIVELLCRQPGCVLTHDYMLKQIWGPYVHGDNKILRVNITNIRKKLEPDPSKPVYIKTENGIGYRMSENSAG